MNRLANVHADNSDVINEYVVPKDVIELRSGSNCLLFDRLSLFAVSIDEGTSRVISSLRIPQKMSEVEIKRLLGSELIDLGFVVPRGELSKKRLKANAVHGGLPASVINTYRIVLLEGCNWACSYCFEKENAPNKNVMKKATLDTLIDEIVRRHNGGNIAIHWFGGEPLLQWALLKYGVCRFNDLVTNGTLSSVDHAMTTHGGLVTPEIASFIAKAKFSVFVSIDGDRETTDRFRRDRKGKGTYDAAMAGYWMLATAGINVGFLLTPIQETVEELSRSVEFLVKTTACRRIGVNTPQPTSDGWRIDGSLLANELLKITRYCSSNGVELTSPSQRILRSLITHTPHVKDCRAPDGSMAVSVAPSGQKSGCIVSWNSDLHKFAGNDDATYLSATDWKLKSHATDACRECIAEMVCGGPCGLEAQLHGLDKNRCDFFQTFLRNALEEAMVQ